MLHHPWFRCGAAGPSVVRRSIGSTRHGVASKTHAISPFRISDEASFIGDVIVAKRPLRAGPQGFGASPNNPL
jgi:hypothetical protein